MTILNKPEGANDDPPK